MSVLAGIETEAGAGPRAGPGTGIGAAIGAGFGSRPGAGTGAASGSRPGNAQVPANAQSKAQSWSGVAQAGGLSSSLPAPESFRSSWQTELASLVSGASTPGTPQTGLPQFGLPHFGSEEAAAAPHSLPVAVPADQSGRAATPDSLPAEVLPSFSESSLRWTLAVGKGSASAAGTVASALSASSRLIQGTRPETGPAQTGPAEIGHRRIGDQSTAASPYRAAEEVSKRSTVTQSDSAGARSAPSIKHSMRKAEGDRASVPTQPSTLQASLILPAPVVVPSAAVLAASSQPSPADLRTADSSTANESPSAARLPGALAPDLRQGRTLNLARNPSTPEGAPPSPGGSD